MKNIINTTGAKAKTLDLKMIATKWLLMSLLTLVTLSVTTKLLAAENLYEKNYKAQNTGNFASLEANPDTKMYVSNHEDKDNISMLENGYDMMGTSGFAAGDVSADLALQHAKAIKADTVLVYSKYGNTKTAASKVEMIKEAAKKGGGVVDDKDLAADDTQYDYYASYWAKLPPPRLGVHIVKLKKMNDEDVAVAEKGLKVLAVIKGSPADVAGLKRGDVLLKLNDINLEKPEELSNVVRQFQGQNVMIEYEHEGSVAVAKAQINKR